ncbi:MAG: 50S ribosomal protein L23 [Ignavibacteriaceae bacterium]|jgi:large subunit ribosomal protein L23|nr:50S ribosomal protein L23 [Ignavibacterium sp.]MCC6253853.1 50S ribosomal protein L23 [Ignavibacteriaceae bacterium]HRN25359.1 50S ribosomal protein L23 [Ignavibacteriaceae bacterium]HRP92490.1 50S ribosomal protein L23 [Ignavibacteriaceae bacterium]HRQ53001.1 50S ribosomal protein L23 [Ignavibacteriaceae bacterium]
MNNILVRPIITEKMTNISANQPGKYGFMVSPKANKIEIKKAIEKKFDVHVIEIRTINHPGKIKSQFRKSGRFEGKTARTKKAIVTLKEGEKIELFEQV